MAEFCWVTESCPDFRIAALPYDVQQMGSASSAPTAAQWMSDAIVVQTRAAQWRKGRDAARRSASVGGERRRSHQPNLRQETVSELKSSFDSENLQGKSVAPMFLDPRGNAMPLNSTGHIHHPFNFFGSWRWARVVDLLLESATFGLRNPLRRTFMALQRVPANP